MIRARRVAGQLSTLVLVALALFVLPLWSVADPAGAPSSAPTMQPISLARWEGVLAEQKGRIVVADLWASWCISCIERFPKMVEMSHRYSGKGVQFMTLNLDDPRDRSGIDWANDFLTRMGGEFAHFHLDENLSQSFEALDLKSLPVVLLYDDEGAERFRLTNDNPNNQFTEQDIEQAVHALVKESAASLYRP